MEFKSSFDYNNKEYKSLNMVTQFESFKPLYIHVYIRIAKEESIYVECSMIGYSKDEALNNYQKSNLHMAAQTRYDVDMSLDEFYELFKSSKDLLNDSLDTLEYLINNYKEKVLNEVLNLKWGN